MSMTLAGTVSSYLCEEALADKSRKQCAGPTENKAHEAGFSIQQTPVGLAFVLAPGGQPITPEQYEKISNKQKEEVRKRQEKIGRAHV